MHPIDAYAEAVYAGRVLAGKYHRLACVRHLRDRQREGTDAFPYHFNAAKADRFLRFGERLKHYKGEWAGQYIHWQPHQVFRLGSIFAWEHRTTKRRRFRNSYNELPRKQGKSLEDAVVALYVVFFDDPVEPGAEGYCAATKRDQAKIVFEDCKRLVVSSGLRTRISVLKFNLHRDSTASKLEPLGADEDSTDGLNPHFVSIDELHAHKTRGMVDVLETATGARRQPLVFKITTAGDDLVSPCGDEHNYACNILDGVLTDETYFAFIAHADPEDDWMAEETARKANPNYGISVSPEDLRAKLAKAIGMPPAAATYKQKHLNLWVNALAPWLSLDGWRRGQTGWTADELREELHGRPCWVGIDLSSKIDLTAIVAAFPPSNGVLSWRLLVLCLTPEDTLAQRAHRDRAPYPEWVAKGLLQTTPGNRIDQHVVQRIVMDLAHQFEVKQIGVDPWNAGTLITDLEAEGLPKVVEIQQTVSQMSAPAKDFEADVLDGLVDAGDNPLMLWAVSNVVVQRDHNDNIFPTKRRSRGRIDPVIAALMARKLATTPPPVVEKPREYQMFVFGKGQQ